MFLVLFFWHVFLVLSEFTHCCLLFRSAYTITFCASLKLLKRLTLESQVLRIPSYFPLQLLDVYRLPEKKVLVQFRILRRMRRRKSLLKITRIFFRHERICNICLPSPHSSYTLAFYYIILLHQSHDPIFQLTTISTLRTLVLASI